MINRSAYLDALGVKQWLLRDTQSSLEEAESQQMPEAIEDRDDGANEIKISAQSVHGLDLAALEKHVAACQACSLYSTRKQTVFGSGHHKADWLIIGEAPGADEDRQGEPFVGRAGQLLTQMLRAIGLAREEVFITNILKCRPPNNRDPKPEEASACRHYLNRQIEILQPKIILALGRIAAQSLLQTDTPIGKMRGQLYHLDEFQIPTVVTYHPAYLLRSPKEKRKVWEDLKFARQQAFNS
ncbi:MAG: uracil-DNA glycosylase [Pseudomonadota bacterium]